MRQTNASQTQPNENAKVCESTAREGVPGRVGNKENPIYDRGNRYQVERDSGCQWCTDKTKIDRFGTPHCAKVSDEHFTSKKDALIPRR